MSFIYGAEMKMVHISGQTVIRRNWYSEQEAVAVQKMETAKLIPVPENTEVEFSLISDAVKIADVGIYKTESGRLVEFYKAGRLHAHGHFLKSNKTPNLHEGCVFFVNGDTCTHHKSGHIVSKVVK